MAMLRPAFRVALLLLVAGALISATALATRAGPTSETAPDRAVARRDAPGLLSKVVLPAGATRLGSEPRDDNGYLKPQRVLVGDAAHVVAHAWWQVMQTPDQLIAFVKAHPPAGGTPAWTSNAGNSRTGTSALSVGFEFKAIPNVLGYRTVTVTATALHGGRTGVLLESQSDWIVERSAAERIPADVREIQIAVTRPGKPSALRLSVTGGPRVGRIVGLLNRLPIAQPIVYACPAEFDPKLITMTFRSATGATLAVLSYADFRPWSAPSVACKTIQLTIGGRPQTSLLGGSFLSAIARILHRSLI
jgi:hypothetical protein